MMASRNRAPPSPTYSSSSIPPPPPPHHLREEINDDSENKMSGYQKSKIMSNGNARARILTSGYFSAESLFLLIGLTASLLILPLVLPPLPPPPFLLLLIPIGILFFLMVLAFSPSYVTDFAYTTL